GADVRPFRPAAPRAIDARGIAHRIAKPHRPDHAHGHVSRGTSKRRSSGAGGRMIQIPATAPAAGQATFSVARVIRLARKELRETLRDRRTIITLVLMPLLVYPVLSVALRQFLVSSSAASKQLPLRIATKTEDEWRKLAVLLAQGDKLIQEHESAAANAP